MGWRRSALLSFLLLSMIACQRDERSTPNSPTVAVQASTPPTEAATATFTALPTTLAPTLAPPTRRVATPAATTAYSGEGEANADVTFVRAVQAGDGTWTFHVTVAHPDTGWEDYADGWDVVTPAGEVLTTGEGDRFTRLLLHPHVDEQPFTRSQAGVAVPEEVTMVTVRAHDLVDGFGGKTIAVDLTAPSGPGFEVARKGE